MKYQTNIPLKIKTRTGEINLQPGDTFKPKNEEAIRQLLIEGRVRPLTEVFEERFNELADKLSKYALTAVEIKTQMPETHKRIHEAIDRIDFAWLHEDLGSFLTAVKTVEELYFKAIREMPEW